MEKINTTKIKKLLQEKNISQLFFSHKIGITPATISAAFHGRRLIPMNKILKIAIFFNVSPFDLVSENDTKNCTKTQIQKAS